MSLATAMRTPCRPPVLPRERHARTVIVELAHVEVERANGTNHDRRHQRRAVGHEQRVEAPTDAIVVEQVAAVSG